MTRIFVYDEWNAFREFDEWGNEVAANIYGAKADEILVRWDATLGFLFYKQDKQGSVVGLLNQNGTEVEKYSYDVFGKPTVTSRDLNSGAWKPVSDRSSFGNRFMFTGREWPIRLLIILRIRAPRKSTHFTKGQVFPV